MIYTGKRLLYLPINKNCLVMRSDNFLVTPFYNRLGVNPYNWGGLSTSGFGRYNLAVSLLADLYGIVGKNKDVSFPRHMSSLIQQFTVDFVSGFEDEWELYAEDITDWLEQFAEPKDEEDNLYTNPLKEIKFSVNYIVEPTGE